MAACAHCGTNFSPKNSRGRFCCGKCRAAAWKKQRDKRESRMRELVKVLAREAGLRAEDFV